MRGQWVGDYNAQYPGRVTVNVDVVGKGFRAVGYLRPNERTMPRMVVRFGTDHQLQSFVVRTENFHLLHPDTGQPVEWERIKDRYGPDMQMSKSIQVHCAWDANSFCARWGTDVGSIGQFELPRSKASDASELVPKITSWQQYRAYIDSLRGRKLVFRGQSKPWRLRTAFHRHDRADLERFALEDIPQLHKYLTSRTRHVFNLSNVLEIGAFMGLAQHHGYPTPLLDWTASPYVAAFFAYRHAFRQSRDKNERHVRILTFDQDMWLGVQRPPQFHPLLLPDLNVSLVDFLAIENERMLPQQGISMQSNVDDIEGYIRQIEQGATNNMKVLEAIDLPLEEHDTVMEELRYMGITAASMFPGLDGICEELKELNFPKAKTLPNKA